MATIRLVASNYGRSNTNYVTVTDAENMYNNTDHSSNYATLRGRAGRSSNSTYYAFINGFNFGAIPSNATVNEFSIKIKAYRGSYQATGNTNYRICLASQASNSYKIGNTTLSEDITTSSSGEVYTIPTGSLTWSQIAEYGSDFSIDIPLRNSSSTNTNYPYVYVYGAEIEVTYTQPNPRTITTTLTGNGTIDPTGTQTYYDGDVYALKITPDNTSDEVTVTNNNVDVTNQLVPHYVPGETTSKSAVLGTYSLVSGGFNGSGASYFQGLVGKGHTASTTTSNYYSSGSGTQAIFHYAISFSNIPSNAIITRLYMMASGHAESTSNSSEYMCVQLKSGNTELSEQFNFKSTGSTNNSTQTIEATTLPTVAQLSNLVVECTLGYYGGAINGVTVYIEYAEPTSDVEYYSYSFEVSENATIAVVIGTVATGDKIYIKLGENRTLVSSVSNWSGDDVLRTTIAYGTIEPGDTVCVECTNVTRWYSGQGTPLENFSVLFTHAYGNRYYYESGSSGPCVHVYQIAPSGSWTNDLQITADYNGQGYYFTGNMSVYKVTGAGGWTLAKDIYVKVSGAWKKVTKTLKKTNGSWAEQDDKSAMFDPNAIYINGQ